MMNMIYLLNVGSSFNDPTNDPKDDTDNIASSTKSRVGTRPPSIGYGGRIEDRKGKGYSPHLELDGELTARECET